MITIDINDYRDKKIIDKWRSFPDMCFIYIDQFPWNFHCDKCPNHPKNGGSGICNCTLGLPKLS